MRSERRGRGPTVINGDFVVNGGRTDVEGPQGVIGRHCNYRLPFILGELLGYSGHDYNRDTKSTPLSVSLDFFERFQWVDPLPL